MKKTNPIDIQKVGFIAKKSPTIPTRLLQACIYQHPPGSHPGQKLGVNKPRRWKLEQKKELVELVTKGRGWVRIRGNEWEEVTPGALLWHMPGDQTIGRSDWDNPYQCLAVAFATPPFHGVRHVPRLSWWKDLEAIQKFSHEVAHWYLDENMCREALLRYVHGRLLFQARLWQRIEEHSELPPKLREALEWITLHCKKKFTLDEVAKIIGRSVPHLHEMFQTHLETTPHQFVLNRRIQIARQQLAATDSPIKQIASDCGFATTASFCSTFKSRIGITPLAYRRQERELNH